MEERDLGAMEASVRRSFQDYNRLCSPALLASPPARGNSNGGQPGQPSVHPIERRPPANGNGERRRAGSSLRLDQLEAHG